MSYFLVVRGPKFTGLFRRTRDGFTSITCISAAGWPVQRVISWG